MMVVKIKQRAHRAGITNGNQLTHALGVSPDVGYRLFNGDFARIDLKTLDRLCARLQCGVGALFGRKSGYDR